jgi:ribosome-associated protein
MPIEVLLQLVIATLDDLKGQRLVKLNVRSLSNITDFMIVVTGTSDRHVRVLAREVALQAKKHGISPLGVEGEQAADWMIVDLGDVIVHIMQAEARQFYDLERLWNPALQKADVPHVDVIGATPNEPIS